MADLGEWWKASGAAAPGDVIWHTESEQLLINTDSSAWATTSLNVNHLTYAGHLFTDWSQYSLRATFSSGQHYSQGGVSVAAGQYRVGCWCRQGSSRPMRLWCDRNSNAYLQMDQAGSIHSVGGSPSSTGSHYVQYPSLSTVLRHWRFNYMDISMGAAGTLVVRQYLTDASYNLSWSAQGLETFQGSAPIIQRLPQTPYALPPASAGGSQELNTQPWVRYVANTAIPDVSLEVPGVSSVWDIDLLQGLSSVGLEGDAKDVTLGLPIAPDLNTLISSPSLGAATLITPIYVPEEPYYYGLGRGGFFPRLRNPVVGERRYSIHVNNRRIQR